MKCKFCINARQKNLNTPLACSGSRGDGDSGHRVGLHRAGGHQSAVRRVSTPCRRAKGLTRSSRAGRRTRPAQVRAARGPAH